MSIINRAHVMGVRSRSRRTRSIEKKKKKMPPPAAAAAIDVTSCSIETIPEKVTSNILSRLTAIELVRCKAVSKSWNSLISSPEFISQHLNRTKSDHSSHHLLVCNSLVFDLNKNVPGPFNSVACFSSVAMVIVGSVNGLICTTGQRLGSFQTADDIWILNPATGLSRQLPLPAKSRLIGQPEAVLFAFWFDGGVYKVAKLVSVADGGRAVLEVWVSDSPDTWSDVTTLDFHFYPGVRFVRDCDVLIEGVAAYWIVANYDEDLFVLWLDLKTLELKSIPLCDEQKYLPVRRSCVLAGIQNNALFGAKLYGKFVVIQNGFCGDGVFYIWQMLMNGGKFQGWKVIYSIQFKFPIERCLAWCTNGRLALQSPGCVLTLHDMDTGDEDYLGTGGDYELDKIWVDSGHDFVGSLVSIDGFERNDLEDLYIGFSWPRNYPHASWGRTCKKKL